MLTYLLIFLLGAIACYGFLRLYPPFLKAHQPQESSQTDTAEERKEWMEEVLKDINCTCSWEKHDDSWRGRYEFQDGHFVVDIDEKRPYTLLSFPFFYETTLANLDGVRHLCNRCNLNSDGSMVVYTVDAEENRIDTHIMQHLSCDESRLKGMLLRAMKDAFGWRNAFVKDAQDIQHTRDASKMDDEELNQAEWERHLFLIREQEITHQQQGFQAHHDPERAMTLGYFVKTLFGLTDVHFMRLTVTTDDGTTRQADLMEIEGYALHKPLIAHGAFCHQQATLTLLFSDVAQINVPRQLSIHLNAEQSTEQTLYFRATATLIPLSMDTDATKDSIATQNVSHSILLAYDLVPSKQLTDEFNYMWKEAQDKYRKGETDTLTPAQQLISDCMDNRLGYHLYRGRILYNQKRFYEALPELLNGFQYMTKQYDTMEKKMREIFFEVCYLIGFSYAELQLYPQALYYLDLALPGNNYTAWAEYINCLVNSGDIRALRIINNHLKNIQAMRDNDEEREPDEIFLRFEKFLHRRKAYVLIEKQRYEEAETLLKTMLDDPANNDFAINELAFLQRIQKDRTKRSSAQPNHMT